MITLAQELDYKWITFIVVASIVLLAIIFLAIFIPLKKKRKQKKYNLHYYKKVRSIVDNNDYYLINNFLFKSEGSTVSKIDHIIFAEKYIYLIFDLYYEGDITGKIDDKSLIYLSFKKKDNGKKYYTDNPFIKINAILNRLSYQTQIDKDMFIGIALINDECNCAIESNLNQYYMIQRKRLPALIKAIEKREVQKINAAQLDKVVKNIAKLNRRKNK